MAIDVGSSSLEGAMLRMPLSIPGASITYPAVFAQDAMLHNKYSIFVSIDARIGSNLNFLVVTLDNQSRALVHGSLSSILNVYRSLDWISEQTVIDGEVFHRKIAPTLTVMNDVISDILNNFPKMQRSKPKIWRERNKKKRKHKK